MNNKHPSNRVVVVAARRSAISKIPGILNYVNEVDLLSTVFRTVSEGLCEWIDSAITGSSFPIERDNLCRKAVLASGMSSRINCATISKTCASSDEALYVAYTKILSGKSQAVLVGGCEKVSNSSYVLRHMKNRVNDSSKGQLPLLHDIQQTYTENDMHYIAEILANKQKISREEQDSFATKSRLNARRAYESHYFDKEIIPIPDPNNDNGFFYADELIQQIIDGKHMDNKTPIFIQNGTLTNYNTSPMCDCAAAMVVMNYETARIAGLKILAEIKDVSCIGVSQEETGMAMERCVEKILQVNNLKKRDIDLYEINESFAAQAIAVIRALGINPDNVNVNGGNLALGYPIGASGLRMCVTLIHEMIRSGVEYGVSSMCGGGAMANAVLIQNIFG